MRQPHSKNCSSVRNRESNRKTLPENTNPIGAPSCGNMPYHARWPGGAFSVASKHRSAPFATETKTLSESANRQQQRRGDAERFICRQDADQHGRHAHRQQRGNERGLAADAIAEVAEHDGPDRPRDERDRECRERCERGGGGVRRRKKQPWKHEHRGRRVDVEIEELDGRADQARKQHLTRRVQGSRRRSHGGDRIRYRWRGVANWVILGAPAFLSPSPNSGLCPHQSTMS